VTVWLPPAVETEEEIVGEGEGSLDHKPYIEVLRGTRGGGMASRRRGMSRRVRWVTG
jgi:hypothetical protein